MLIANSAFSFNILSWLVPILWFTHHLHMNIVGALEDFEACFAEMSCMMCYCVDRARNSFAIVRFR